MGFFGRIREGLPRTKQVIVGRFDDIVRRADAPDRRSRPVGVETLDALEELLISADIGAATTGSLRDLVKQEVRDVLAAVDRPIVVAQPPRVTLVVGVNGTGKTTTV